MVDFFEGSPADISWYPPDNDEKGKKLGAFFQNQAAPPKTLNRIPNVLKKIESQRSGISEWGIVGYCWGGKIVNLTSQEGTAFKAAASCHPVRTRRVEGILLSQTSHVDLRHGLTLPSFHV